MITTERLHLRKFSPNDCKAVHEYASDPDFSKFEMWGPNTEKDTLSFIEHAISKSQESPQYDFEFAVCLNDSGHLIGGCSLRLAAQESVVASIGYAINPKYQNTGYATELGQTLLNYGFGHLNLSVIWASCDTRNHASYKVMEKLGMTRVGVIRKNRKISGELFDSYRYEITQESHV